MFKLLKRIFVREKKKELTVADLPPYFKIETNGIGQYRWVKHKIGFPALRSDEFYTYASGIYDSVNDCVSDAKELYEENTWRTI